MQVKSCINKTYNTVDIKNRIIEFKNVSLGYGKQKVLENVNLIVNEGEVFGLVGPNGSGKSTLLRAILGQLKPRSGKISYKKDKLSWGYVPQRDQVDPIWPISVRQLLDMTLRVKRSIWSFNGKDNGIVAKVISLTGLKNLEERTLDTLSGGELQRVLLARALVIEPDILLLDEPTAAMDIVASSHFHDLIINLHNQWKFTVVMVCHDLSALADRTDRLGILKKGKLYSGKTKKILTSSNLSNIYRRPLIVKKISNKTFVFPEEFQIYKF